MSVNPDGSPGHVAAGELVESAWGNAVSDGLARIPIGRVYAQIRQSGPTSTSPGTAPFSFGIVDATSGSGWALTVPRGGIKVPVAGHWAIGLYASFSGAAAASNAGNMRMFTVVAGSLFSDSAPTGLTGGGTAVGGLNLTRWFPAGTDIDAYGYVPVADITLDYSIMTAELIRI